MGLSPSPELPRMLGLRHSPAACRSTLLARLTLSLKTSGTAWRSAACRDNGRTNHRRSLLRLQTDLDQPADGCGLARCGGRRVSVVAEPGSMNRMPASSGAAVIFAAVASRPPSSASEDSRRASLQSCLVAERNRSAVHYPEDLSLSGQVLEQPVRSIPPTMRTPSNRLEMARNILACVDKGTQHNLSLRR